MANVLELNATRFLHALISYLEKGQQRLNETQKSNLNGFNSIISVLKRQQQISHALATQLRADLVIIRQFVDDDVDFLRNRWDFDIDPLIEVLINNALPELRVRDAPTDGSRLNLALQEMIEASNSMIHNTLPKGHLSFVRAEFQRFFADITRAMQTFRKLLPVPSLTPERILSAVIEFRDAYMSFSTQIQQISYDKTRKGILSRSPQIASFNGLIPSSSFTSVRNKSDQKPALLRSVIHFSPMRLKIPRILHGLASLTSHPTRIADLNRTCHCGDSADPKSCCRSINIWSRIADIDFETFTSELHFEKHISSWKYRSYLTSAGISWFEVPPEIHYIMADDLMVDDEENTSYSVRGSMKWVHLQRRISFPSSSTLRDPVVRVWFTGLEFRVACMRSSELLPLEMSIMASNVDCQGFDVTVRYPHSLTSDSIEGPVFRMPTVGFSWFAHEADSGELDSGSGAPMRFSKNADEMRADMRKNLYTTAEIEGVDGRVFVGLSGFAIDWQTENSIEVGVCDLINGNGTIKVAGSGTGERMNWMYDWVALV